jgi:hypothetical protein
MKALLAGKPNGGNGGPSEERPEPKCFRGVAGVLTKVIDAGNKMAS